MLTVNCSNTKQCSKFAQSQYQRNHNDLTCHFLPHDYLIKINQIDFNKLNELYLCFSVLSRESREYSDSFLKVGTVNYNVHPAGNYMFKGNDKTLEQGEEYVQI